jgi:acetyltransferase-like isoleucine patch superfamily enzyme
MTHDEAPDPVSREQIRALDARLRFEMRARWDRDLPFEELIGDRWERARSLGFGEGSSVYATSYIYGEVSAGKNVWVGPSTLLDGTGGLSIGDWVTISAGVHVYTHDTVARTVSGGRAEIARSPVVIGDRTYIGANVVVARGVTIGSGCVIGAGSFVNRAIPDRTFGVGSPCRVIGTVEVDRTGAVRLLLTER